MIIIEIKLKNEKLMNQYLSWIIGRQITEQEFVECINYFKDTGEYIYEQRESKTLIQEGASLEAEIDDEFYEVWVTYNYIVVNNQVQILIDFDYTYDEFIESLPFEVY